MRKLNESMVSLKHPVIIHFHIFKNAGMTIEWVLEKNFTKNFAREAYGINFDKIIPMELVVDYLKKNPNVKCFSSHNIRFPIPKENFIDFIPILFIRHPIDKAFSTFNFTRLQLEKGHGRLETKNMTLEEYFQWHIKSNDRLVLDSQLQLLSDKTLKTLPERVSSALENIKNCAILGVVDRFDESMVVAEEFLKNYFKDIDLSYVIQNISKDRTGNLSQRLETAKEQISNELMNELTKKNNNDIKIYEFANAELNNRIKNVENFQSKLYDFKERCIQLNNRKIINYILDVLRLKFLRNNSIQLEYSPNKKIITEI